jgi:MYXO-CTERM domain-containing protein
MWSCRDVGGFCTEDTEEHGECIDGRFSYGVCSPAPYCGLQSGAAASGDDRSDEEQHRADMSADGANGAGSDEDPREREADDDATGRTAVSDATVDGGGCSLSTPTRASGASSWALAALSLVVFGGRRARRFPSQPRARLADVC